MTSFKSLIIAALLFGCSDIDTTVIEKIEQFEATSHICTLEEEPLVEKSEIFYPVRDPLYFTPEPEPVIYNPSLRYTITVSDTFNEAQQAAIIKAFDAVEEMTGGLLTLDPFIGPTTCGQDLVVHGDYQWNCSLWSDDHTEFRAGWYFGQPFRITVRHSNELLKKRSARETYTVTLHELGHGIGLKHGEGFMNQSIEKQLANTTFTLGHAKRVAKHFNWDRHLFHVGDYSY